LEKKSGNLHIKENFDKLSELHPVDIAEIIEELGHEERRDFMQTMNDEKMADVITEMELDIQVKLFEGMDVQRASDILEEMPADDAADILGELTTEQSDKIITLMEPGDAEDMRELMSYSDGTAGALMTTDYISLPACFTVQEAIEQLRKSADKAETIYYLYVVDEKEVLQGVLSLRELIISKPHVSLEQLMHTKVRSVRAEEDHNKAMDIVSKYTLLALPVLNDQGQMLGIITVDDLLRIIIPDRSGFKTFSHYVLTARKG
jgi:Mg2+ transporter MgtE